MGPGEFLNINFFTALFTLANTVLLFAVLKKFLFRPVMDMITARQQEIDDLYAAADDARRAAQTLEEEYRQKMDSAAQTGERVVQAAVARGQSREEEIVRQANAEADAIVKKAQADAAQEKKKAINDAKNEISAIAMDIAGKVVGHALKEEDQTALVDRFIEKLGEEA